MTIKKLLEIISLKLLFKHPQKDTSKVLSDSDIPLENTTINPEDIEHQQYADKLLLNNNYTSLLEIIENGYEITNKQNILISQTLSVNLFFPKHFLQPDKHLSYKELIACIKIYSQIDQSTFCEDIFHILSHAYCNSYLKSNSFLNITSTKPLEKSISKLSSLSINKKNDEIKNVFFEDANFELVTQLLLKIFQNIMKDTKIDEKAKRNQFNFFQLMIPLEFQFVLVILDNKLSEYFNMKNSFDMAQDRKEGLTFYHSKFLNFTEYISSQLTEKYENFNSNSIEHLTVLQQLKDKSRFKELTSDFNTFNFSKVYNLPDELTQSINIIQAYYGKFSTNSHISSEDKNYVDNIPTLILKTINLYQNKQELDLSLNNKDETLEQLNTVVAFLANLNLSLEQDKVNQLVVHHKKQKMLSK